MTGLFPRLLASLAAFGVVLAPVAPAYADSLESEFDKTFQAPPAPASAAKLQTPKAQSKPKPVVETARPPQVSTVRPYVSNRASRSYASSLEAQIGSLADDSQGRIGVAAIDLSTGRTISVLGDTPFPLASTSKIAIVATFLDGVDHGRFSLDSSYPLMVPVKSRKYSTSVAPVRAGSMMTGRQLVERALIHSDNTATDAILAVIGGPAAVNRWIRSTGIVGLRLDRDIATLVRDDGEYNPSQLIDERDSATPMAMAQLLSGIYQGRWLSPASRDFLLSTMERCETGKHRMRALLPADARVAHKTGTLANVASDVGIIRTPDGRVFAVAVYVTGQGGHAGRDAKIAQITRAVYDGYLGNGPGYYASAQR